MAPPTAAAHSARLVVPTLLGAVALAQAVALAAWTGRGFWSAADLLQIRAAAGTALTGWVPATDGARAAAALVHWLAAHGAGLDWSATVVVRGCLQAVATLLLGHLLLSLLGPRAWVVLAVTGYATWPWTLAAFVDVTAAATQLPVHVLVLTCLVLAVRYHRDGGALALTGSALSAGAAVLWWPPATATALAALVVVAGWATTTVAGLRSGRTWAPPALAAVVAGVLLVVRALLAHSWSVSQVVADAGRYLDTVDVAPWGHLDPADLAGLLTRPATWPAVVVAAALVALAVAGTHRQRRAAVGWAAVALAGGVRWVLAAGGSRSAAEVWTSAQWSDLVLPLLLVVTWSATAAAQTPHRAPSGTGAAPDWPPAGSGTARSRVRPALAALVAGAWALTAVVVGSAVVHPEWAGTTGRWLDAATQAIQSSTAKADQQEVYLYDVLLPASAQPDGWPAPEPGLRTSEVLALHDLPVQFDRLDQPLHVLDDQGRLVPAGLTDSVQVGTPTGQECLVLLQGRQTASLNMGTRLPTGPWFAHVDYLANPQPRVRVELAPGTGGAHLTAADPAWDAGLATVVLRATAPTGGDRLVLTGLADDVNLCVGAVTVGVPGALP